MVTDSISRPDERGWGTAEATVCMDVMLGGAAHVGGMRRGRLEPRPGSEEDFRKHHELSTPQLAASRRERSSGGDRSVRA